MNVGPSGLRACRICGELFAVRLDTADKGMSQTCASCLDRTRHPCACGHVAESHKTWLAHLARKKTTVYICGPCGHLKHDTHCPHGHPWSENETRLPNGARRCRECNKIRSARYHAKKRGER